MTRSLARRRVDLALRRRRREVVIDLVFRGRAMRRSERAIARDTSELVGAGAVDKRPITLRGLAIEEAGRLDEEAALLPADAPDDALNADERRGVRVVIRHQPDHAALALNVTRELLSDLRLRQLAAAFKLLICLLVPILDLECALC